MKRMRRNHEATFKAQVATFRGDKTLAELAEQFCAHPIRSQDALAIVGAGCRCIWWGQTDVEHAGSQDPPHKDRTTGAGE